MAEPLEPIPQQKDLERKMARIRERLAWRPDHPDQAAPKDAPAKSPKTPNSKR